MAIVTNALLRNRMVGDPTFLQLPLGVPGSTTSRAVTDSSALSTLAPLAQV